MLDGKILDRAKRLIQARLKKRQRLFPDELSSKLRELHLSGNSPNESSTGKKIIRNMFAEELENRAPVIWESLQQAHEASDSQLTETLACDLKEEATRFLSEITKELSEFMMKQSGFTKDDIAKKPILDSAKNDACEKIDIGIDLYINSLTKKSAEAGQTQQAQTPSEIDLIKQIAKKLRTWADQNKELIHNFSASLTGPLPPMHYERVVVYLQGNSPDMTGLVQGHYEELISCAKKLDTLTSDGSRSALETAASLVGELRFLANRLAQTLEVTAQNLTLKEPAETREKNKADKKPQTKMSGKEKLFTKVFPTYPFKSNIKNADEYLYFTKDHTDLEILQKAGGGVRISLTKEQLAVIDQTVGSRKLSDIKCFLTQKCNIQDPTSLSWDDVLNNLGFWLKSGQPAGTGRTQLQNTTHLQPTLENISAIVNKIEELKKSVEKCTGSFLSPVEAGALEAAKANKIFEYVEKLPKNKGRINLIELIGGSCHIPNFTFGEYKNRYYSFSNESAQISLTKKTDKKREEYYSKNTKPLIHKIEKLLSPFWNHLEMAGSWGAGEQARIEAAIKSKDPAALDEVVRELDKIKYKIQIECQQQPKQIGTERKTKKTKTPKKTEKRFQPWRKSGDACFIIENNRIHFHYRGKIKDLCLKSGSRTDYLLKWLQTGPSASQVIKEKFCSSGTRPYDLKYVANEKLNNKIAALGFVDVQQNYEFIKYSKITNDFESVLKIYPSRSEFDQQELQQPLIDDRQSKT